MNDDATHRNVSDAAKRRHAANRTDLTGVVVGRLTVMHSDPSNGIRDWKWVCRCNCGNEVSVRGNRLTHGKPQTTCGKCAAREYADLTGKRVGLLTVVGLHEHIEGKPTKWNCVCDCGSTCIRTYNTLIYNRESNLTPTSCGCARRLLSGQSSRNAWLCKYQRAAMKRGLDWMLTDEAAFTLFESPCHYCGLLPDEHQYKHSKSSNGSYACTGIDRVDNNIGYVPGNVVPCCGKCNFAKGSMPYDEWINWLNRVTAFRSRPRLAVAA